MESNTEIRRLQPVNIALVNPCEHGRLIDDVLTQDGIRTGQVRCLECCAVIDDPHRHEK